MKKKILSVLSLALLLSSCQQEPTTVEKSPSRTHVKTVPLLGVGHKNAIPGEYIIFLHDHYDAKTLNTQNVGGLTSVFGLDPKGVKVKNIYSLALQGFSAQLSQKNLEILRKDSRIKYIAQNRKLQLATQPQRSKIRPFASQTGATWGIDRIDQRNLPLDRTYNYEATGTGVNAYVIDTGVRYTHSDFGGRARGKNFTDESSDADGHGHGTHVAGTVGGKQSGIAKNVNIISVKAMNSRGGGNWDHVIAGIEWALADRNGKPAVANMSIGSDAYQAIDDVVSNAIRKGMVMVIAAMNYGKDACNYSPARVREAIVVMASDRQDNRSGFSNYGSCTDITAPGSGISSAAHTQDSGFKILTGTSQASPHVAGAVALILSGNNNMSPAQVKAKLLADATPNKVKNAGTGSPSKLLFVNQEKDGDNPPPPPPGEQIYEGSVNVNSSSFQPNSKGFEHSGGELKAVLSSSANGDFDLYLQRKEGVKWIDVASSIQKGNNESITLNATVGKYRWEVYAYEGGGEYKIIETKDNP